MPNGPPSCSSACRASRDADHGESSRPYQTALEQQRARSDDVDRTPSARLLTEMRQTGESFFQLAQRMSRCTRTIFSICIAERAPPGEFAAAAQNHTRSRRESKRRINGISTPIWRITSRIERHRREAAGRPVLLT